MAYEDARRRTMLVGKLVTALGALLLLAATAVAVLQVSRRGSGRRA